MKSLVDYIYEEEKQYIELNSALAGEIFLYSETNKLFSERKEAICKAFKERLKPEIITADYISHTLVFKKYIKDLIIYYLVSYYSVQSSQTVISTSLMFAP